MCFAVGMGPIPFIYTAEVFPQNARAAAMSIAVLANWISNLLVALCFPMLQSAINQYVFCIFAVILALTLALVLKKVPETKNKTVDEILGMFNKNSNQNSWKMTNIA
jgi:MFS family permease